MKLKRKVDIKKFYESKTGIVIPNGFEIHHIDCKKFNNKFENLVALPKEIHNRYHRLKPQITLKKTDYLLQSKVEQGSGSLVFYHGRLNEFIIVYNECIRWVDYRDYLTGMIPNIHGIRNYGI